MMDAAEEIPLLLCPEKKPCLDDGETLEHSPAQVAAAIAKVLDDDNLLWEIIIRVGLPTTLVRAALVCKRWLGHASDPKFLSCFCKLHPPRLLGYYITEGLELSMVLDAPRFVPMLPQPPELATIMRRLESYNFGTSTKYILDCRNGSLLTMGCHAEGRWTHRVHCPLCAEKGVQIIPPLPCGDYHIKINSATLSKNDGSGLSYLHVFWENTREEENSMMSVYMLVDGVWRMHTSVTSIHVLKICSEEPLVGNEIYMLNTSSNNIVALDLKTSSFSTIQLPQGVTYEYCSMLSWEDDTSSLYLIHVEEFQLRVWVHKGGHWLLVDTICLREMLATLGMSDHTLEDESMHIIQVGHSGLFVFLQRGHCIFSLDIKGRTMCKVYEEIINERHFDSIYPFMMIWPPTFPPSRMTLPERPSEDGSF